MYQPKELRKKRFEHFHAQSPEIWGREIYGLLFKHPVSAQAINKGNKINEVEKTAQVDFS